MALPNYPDRLLCREISTLRQIPRSPISAPTPWSCGRYHGIYSGVSEVPIDIIGRRRPRTRRGGILDVQARSASALGGRGGISVESKDLVATYEASARCHRAALALNSRLNRELASIEKSRREIEMRHRRDVELIWDRLEHVRYEVTVPLDDLQV